MRNFKFRLGLIALAVPAALAFATAVNAQLAPMGIPIPTTIVVTKPAPGQIFGDRQVITLGVEGKTYKLLLRDAYVDDPSGKVHWPDIWQQVVQYKPNFNVTGLGQDTFEKMQPGQTLTVRGVYAALNQNFEVMGTDMGGPSGPAKHY
ncbi:MAG TPA: hypothetical protein VEU51_16245 [Candidatus Acidoferrales bacterium]|nr:hypothetical protein [Candidatus Acidoferrales bacterium]